MNATRKWVSTILVAIFVFAAQGVASAQKKLSPKENAAITLLNTHKWIALVDLSKNPPLIKWLSEIPVAEKKFLEGIIKDSDAARPAKDRKKMKGLFAANSKFEFSSKLGMDGRVQVASGERVECAELWKAMELLEKERKEKERKEKEIKKQKLWYQNEPVGYKQETEQVAAGDGDRPLN